MFNAEARNGKQRYGKERPIVVTVICLIYVVAGAAGIVYHAPEMKFIFRQPDVILVFILRLLAAIGGVFALRGKNWARWVIVAWIVYHVYLSLGHAPEQLLIHAIIAILTIAALFHARADRYFSNR